MPPQWMMYINVENLAESLSACTAGGGLIAAGPKAIPGYGRYAVIQDPAGAVCALFEPETGGDA